MFCYLYFSYPNQVKRRLDGADAKQFGGDHTGGVYLIRRGLGTAELCSRCPIYSPFNKTAIRRARYEVSVRCQYRRRINDTSRIWHRAFTK